MSFMIQSKISKKVGIFNIKLKNLHVLSEKSQQQIMITNTLWCILSFLIVVFLSKSLWATKNSIFVISFTETQSDPRGQPVGSRNDVVIPSGSVALFAGISSHWPPKALLEYNSSTQDVKA